MQNTFFSRTFLTVFLTFTDTETPLTVLEVKFDTHEGLEALIRDSQCWPEVFKVVINSQLLRSESFVAIFSNFQFQEFSVKL